MADDIAESEIVTWLERANPFTEQEPRLLGVWPQPPAERLVLPQERVRWRTRHGLATVAWLFNFPQLVWAALCVDGTRCNLCWTVDGGFRRAVSGTIRWRYGTIDVRTDDVYFIDGEQPPFSAPSADVSALESDLADDHLFATALQDERLAHAAYDVIVNHSFLRIDSIGPWISVSDRDAARLVAALRGAGESLEDFFVDEDNFHDWPSSRHAGYAFKGVWPDDRTWRETQLVEQIREQRAQSKSWFNLARTNNRSLLAHYEQELAELRSDPNGDVMRLLHGHLTRLDWRTVTSDDRKTAEERALDQRVAILHEIRILEARQALPQSFAALTGPLDGDRRIQFAEAERADVLAKLSPDRREAYFQMALLTRIRDLASAGRISELERRDLEARLREASQRYR